MTLTPDESLKSYSPELPKTLEEAFQSDGRCSMPTCRLRAMTPRNENHASRTLVRLVAEGITDPKGLRRKALESMVLSG